MGAWPLVRLGDLGTVVTGATPKTNDESLFGGNIPFVTPSELDQSDPVTSSPRTLSPEGFKGLRGIPKDAVMVCCIASLGKVGIAGCDLSTNQQINSVVFDKEKVFPRYGYYACQRLKPELVKIAPATTVPIVSKSKFQNLEIPVPPLEEQKRIAAILDQADDIRRKRQHAIERLNQLGQAIFHEMFGDNNEDDALSFDEVVFFQEGPGVRKWQFRDEGVKLINVRNIVDGHLDTSNTNRYLEPAEAYGKYKHFLLQEGDYVLASSGVTWGKIAEVRDSDLPLCLNTSMIRVRPKNKNITKEYLRSFVEMGSFRSQIDRLITGSAQPNFGPSHLRQVKIPVPDLKDQDKFSQKISKLKDSILSMQSHLSAIENLFNSLQHRAFKGQL